MTLVDMDALRESHPRLFRTVTKDLGLGSAAGEQEIDMFKLSDFSRGELFGWFTQHEFNAKAAKAAAARAAATPSPPPVVEKPAEPQISMAEIEAEQRADLKRAADQARATNRLNEYAAVGLEDTQHNAELIKDFVNNSPAKGYWSFEIVEVAIQTLGNKLTWKPQVVEQPPAPTPQEPVEVLEPWQLSLDATEAQMKKADVRALKDLLARRRAIAGKYHRPRGSWGSNLF